MINFPLQTIEFWDMLTFESFTALDLLRRQKHSEDASGNTLTAYLGYSKWWGKFTLSVMDNDTAKTQEALFKMLTARNGTFLAYDLRHPYPRYDPDGTIAKYLTVQVKTKGSNNRSISAKGLQVAYQLSVGDKFAIKNEDGLRAMFEVMEFAKANSSQNTDEFEIQPPLPTWVQVDDEIDLVRPVSKFRIVPGSFKAPTVTQVASSGAYFEIISAI